MSAPEPAAASAQLPPARRALGAAALIEPLSLLVLLTNLATVHLAGLAAAVGPVHGTAYLVGIGATWAGGYPRRARALAWVPGVGALLAARSPQGPAPISPPDPPGPSGLSARRHRGEPVVSSSADTAAPTGAVPTEPDPRRWKALAVLALAQLMLVLDASAVNVALGPIKADLHFSQPGLTWVIDSYLLTAGGLLLLGGRLSDLLGRRRVFLAGVAIFAVASAVSGAAQNPPMLIISRFAQGLGEALAGPAAFGLVALLFTEPGERTKAIGIFGGFAGLGVTCGPVISGLLVSVSWRLIFLVNLPAAAFVVVAVLRLVEESRADVRTRTGRPDILGAVLVTAGLTSLVYGLIEAATKSWSSAAVVVSLATAAVLLALFAAVEARTAQPLVPAGFFTNRVRVVANTATVFFTSGLFGMFLFVTLYLEQVKHWSAIRTGLAYLPFGVCLAASIGLTTALLLPRVGLRLPLGFGILLAAAGLLIVSRITATGSYSARVLPGLLVLGLGAGMCFVSLSNASVHEVSEQDASLASGVQNAAQQIGGAIGLAVLSTLALRHTVTAAAGGAAPSVSLTEGYSFAMRVGAAIAAVGAVGVLVFLRPAVNSRPPVQDSLR